MNIRRLNDFPHYGDLAMARSVSITTIPKDLTAEQERMFLRHVQEAMDIDHPYVVLDCSNLSNLDRRTLLLLLHCLEEAMKRNGEVRLAAISSLAMTDLEQAGAARLFRIYSSSAEALDSFHRPFTTAVQIERLQRSFT